MPDGSGSQAIDSQKSQDQSNEETLKKKEEDKKKKESMSIQSNLTSSLVETSEDEEKKRREAEKKKKDKKGLTAEDLERIIDVELKESETCIMMNIPARMIFSETEEEQQIQEINKKYEELRQNKIGSDSYMHRASQTLNLTQKHKNNNFVGFSQESKEVTASKYDIDDASKQEKISDAEQQVREYYKSIEDIMTEKLKNSKNLFDVDAPASHLSIQTSKSDVKNGKSGSNSSKGPRSKMKSSQSGMKESKNESEGSSSAS